MKPIPQSTDLPDDVVLSVRNVSKKFCRNLKRSMWYGLQDLGRSFLGKRPGTAVRDSRLGIGRDAPDAPNATNETNETNSPLPPLRRDEFWAVDRIRFDLHRGESLGIIGMNGSGKSTLLRILSGIFPPDEGCVAFRGQISGLIALGAGMHPHMTGRENIYLNGAILGMPRAEIDAKFDSIVQFTELEAFLEAPLSTYSSGMKVKLGFGVAIHREPDILLIDEVLSVGDYSFVNKSLRFLHEYRQKARALIYVSHNLEQVRGLCDRVIVLDKGHVIFDGESNEAMRMYQDHCSQLAVASINATNKAKPQGKGTQVVDHSEDIEFLGFGLCDENGAALTEVEMDRTLIVYARFTVHKGPRSVFFSVGILDERKTVVMWLMSNDFDKAPFRDLTPGDYEMRATIADHRLMPGVYFPSVAIRDDETMEMHSRFACENAFVVRSKSPVVARGLLRADETWELRRTAEE